MTTTITTQPGQSLASAAHHSTLSHLERIQGSLLAILRSGVTLDDEQRITLAIVTTEIDNRFCCGPYVADMY